MESDVSELAAESGRLIRVKGVPATAGRSATAVWYRSLQLEFSSGALNLRCDDNTDEILVTTGTSDLEAIAIEELWAQGLVGKWIEYAWDLQNHRGYNDAFQLRLMNDEREEEVVQFEVAGSTITVSKFA